MKKVIIFSAVLIFLISACSLSEQKIAKDVLGLDQAKAKTVGFINNNLMKQGQTASIKEVVEENGLYKVVVNIPDGQEIISYLSLDGKKFFPQVMDIEETEQKKAAENANQAAQQSQTIANVTKSDKPSVEVFVMSHCPYGTQIEKGILPVLDKLGDKIDFELKFCDYAMHGQKELDEQLNQYCIQKNEPDKLKDYLYCFLEADKGAECLEKEGINKTKLSTCVAATDKEFKVTENFENKVEYKGRFPSFNVYKEENKKYGITGSPGLVINGKKISSGRDPATLLKTICAGFNEIPAECDAELASAAPSPGFGFSGTGSNSNAGCGS